MSYTEFAEKMLIALYQESENDEPYPEGITFGALIDRYGLPHNERWLDRLAKEWETDGLAEVSDLLEPSENLEVEITGRGMRRIEQVFGGKDGVGTILEPAREGPELRPGTFDEDIFDPAIFDTGDAIDSSRWTGLPRSGTLSSEAVERVKVAIATVNEAIESAGCSNEEKAQARAFVIAINALADAPEPPADLIWKIVERANSVAGIASLFVALIALFAHA